MNGSYLRTNCSMAAVPSYCIVASQLAVDSTHAHIGTLSVSGRHPHTRVPTLMLCMKQHGRTLHLQSILMQCNSSKAPAAEPESC